MGIPRSMALRAPFRAPFVSRKGRKRMGLPLSWVPAFEGMTAVLQRSQHRGTAQAPGFPGCRGRFETCPYGVIVSLGMGRASPATSLRLLASPCASRRGGASGCPGHPLRSRCARSRPLTLREGEGRLRGSPLRFPPPHFCIAFGISSEGDYWGCLGVLRRL